MCDHKKTHTVVIDGGCYEICNDCRMARYVLKDLKFPWIRTGGLEHASMLQDQLCKEED